jgi:hypothetical protein
MGRPHFVCSECRCVPLAFAVCEQSTSSVVEAPLPEKFFVFLGGKTRFVVGFFMIFRNESTCHAWYRKIYIGELTIVNTERCNC